MMASRNAERFLLRFLLVVLAVIGLGSFGILMALVCGCGNQPLLIGRDVLVDGDLTVLGDTEVAGSLDVGEEVTADDVIVGDNLEVVDDAEIDGNLTVDGNVEVVGDLGLGGEIVELPEPPLPSPPPPPPPLPPPPVVEPALLTATIKSVGDKATFSIGELIQYEVIATGGVSPWSLRCLRPDGQFTVVDNSDVSHFEFSFRINSPGSGTINCRITSGGQEANVWAAIAVQ